MSDSIQRPRELEGITIPANIVPRLKAMSVDLLIVLALCWPMVRSFDESGELPASRWLAPAGWTLAGLIAVECLSGRTPGKALFGLTLRYNSPHFPPIVANVIRGVTRHAVTFTFLLSRLPSSEYGCLFVYASAFTVLGIWVQACYYLLMRAGVTLFDTAAATTLRSAAQ